MLITLSSEVDTSFSALGVSLDFLAGFVLYVLLLLALVLFGRIYKYVRQKDWEWPLHAANILLIVFFVFFHFVFASHLAYSTSFIFSSSQALFALTSLFFYFFGLWVFYFSSYFTGKRKAYSFFPSAYEKASMKIRFLLPFSVPFLFFTFLFDLANILPFPFAHSFLSTRLEGWEAIISLGVLTACFLLASVFLFPPFLQFAWGCEPLEEGVLKQRLEDLCQKASFRNGGLKVWTVMTNAFTAAIVGIIPRFRYIIFTRRMLQQFPPSELEAILSHEIGHSYHRHLLFYPLVVVGMLLFQGLCSLFLGESFDHFMALLRFHADASFWEMSFPLFIFLFYALLFVLYFRLVYGFISRNFERQADLHVFHLEIPPEEMVQALDRVGTLSGGIHDKPSWHHFSIRQRMHFLNQAIANPQLVKRHHQRVKKIVFLFPCFLVFMLSVLVSSQLKDYPFFSSVHHFVENRSDFLKRELTYPIRNHLAEQYLVRYPLEGDQEVLLGVIAESYEFYGADSLPGVMEFYASQDLLAKREYQASISLMILSWKTFDFESSHPSVLEDFISVTQKIISAAEEEGVAFHHIQALMNVMHQQVR